VAATAQVVASEWLAVAPQLEAGQPAEQEALWMLPLVLVAFLGQAPFGLASIP